MLAIDLQSSFLSGPGKIPAEKERKDERSGNFHPLSGPAKPPGKWPVNFSLQNSAICFSY
ncbi:MAG: hypothetical protein ACOC3F_03055 [Desulfosudaceae bacterium]